MKHVSKTASAFSQSKEEYTLDEIAEKYSGGNISPIEFDLDIERNVEYH